MRARGAGCDWGCGVEVDGDWEGGGGVVGLMLVVVGVDGGSMTSAMVGGACCVIRGDAPWVLSSDRVALPPPPSHSTSAYDHHDSPDGSVIRASRAAGVEGWEVGWRPRGARADRWWAAGRWCVRKAGAIFSAWMKGAGWGGDLTSCQLIQSSRYFPFTIPPYSYPTCSPSWTDTWEMSGRRPSTASNVR